MNTIDSLLNRETAAAAAAAAAAARRPAMAQQHFTQTTTYEAADALTTLATLGSGQQYAPAPARELPSPSPTAASHALQ
jgi:COMPASS component SPP1